MGLFAVMGPSRNEYRLLALLIALQVLLAAHFLVPPLLDGTFQLGIINPVRRFNGAENT